MIFAISGSLGDEIALTGLVREFIRAYPDERVHIQCRWPDLWVGNPRVHSVNAGNESNLVWLPLGINPSAGNLVHAYASYLKAIRGLDIPIVNSQPELFLNGARMTFGGGRPRVAFDAWAGWPRRRWPHFTQLVSALEFAGIYTIELGASTADCFGDRRPGPVPGVSCSFLDKLCVRETAELMACCDLYVGNDSGLAHMAIAVGIPAVVICALPWWSVGYPSFGRRPGTTPIFPTARHCDSLGCDVKCNGDNCLTSIDPKVVMAAITGILGQP